MDHDPGGVDRPAQPHSASVLELCLQPCGQVARIGSCADLLTGAVEHGAGSVHGKWVLRRARQLVDRWQISQLHTKSVERAAIIPLVATATLPHWDLTPFFPSVDSPEVTGALEDLGRRAGELRELFD